MVQQNQAKLSSLCLIYQQFAFIFAQIQQQIKALMNYQKWQSVLRVFSIQNQISLKTKLKEVIAQKIWPSLQKINNTLQNLIQIFQIIPFQKRQIQNLFGIQQHQNTFK
ncbi:hypothetical protein TTHERM_000052309 (macronuclear) [Tetrahymena thermophila SB210]|uniref:Uncharacterized protein n=1 Tax=Tetrahymena thermophila (strain SB210) TaxID=312017 RepID=W7XDC6_TETTS|nr:hypothetical protein TTHERM_000052309 [Tetrahymena thermophila SB210]EWS74643.1 hypothetical protein TTHERM_000052309 [Tetrahymena thermophila SB210]|eukprot:XP_012652865.1 hypothetical protein TTHERM_000052309 [Tetrahymena thermophila SB210]